MRKPKLVKLAALALASVCAIGLLAGCSSSSGGAPATSNGEHPTITINALNANGVSGSLFPPPVSDQEIASTTPTGWKANIQTVTLTGARIKELAEQGYDCHDNGIYYPCILTTKEGTQLDDNTTYKVAICGVTDEIKAEGNLTDNGVLGLTAMQNYLKQFDTLSTKDIGWK